MTGLPDPQPVHGPPGWGSAERAAAELIRRAADAAPPVGSFEFRMTRDVLAVTLLLADVVEQVRQRSTAALQRCQVHLADEADWWTWCQIRLHYPGTELAASDLLAARARVRWLLGIRLLTGPTSGKVVGVADRDPVASGWRPALDLEPARRIVGSVLPS